MPTSALMRLAAAVTIVLAVMSAAARATERTVNVTFLLVCDVYDMSANGEGRGGMAKIAGVIARERAARSHVYAVHAGDAISPSLMSGLDQGEHMIDLLNSAGLDLFVPGNHEFDFGRDVFLKRMSEARFPVLAANLRDGDGSALAGIGDTALLDFDGLKVGVIGLTAEDSPRRSSPGSLTFSPSITRSLDLAADLRKQGADLIVVAAHAPRAVDDEMRAARDADIIVSGDDHDLLVAYDGNTAFAEAMQDGYVVVAIDVTARIRESDGKRRVSWHPQFRIIETAGAEPDAAMAERVAGYEKLLSAELDQPLASLGAPMDSRNETVRGGEAAIGNLYADAIRDALGADAALLNGGGFRGKKSYEAGSQVTRRDVLAELPFGNKTYLLELKGATLKAALEQGLARADGLTGAFPQVSGLRIKADLSRPAGQRVISLEIDGRPAEDGARYTLATNDFLARGGDGYDALKAAKVLVGATDGKLIANHVMAYLRKAGTVTPALDGRVSVGRLKAAD